MFNKKEYFKKYRLENKEHTKKYNKKYRLKNEEYFKNYRLENEEYFKKYHTEYYENNKEKMKIQMKEWRESEKGRTCCNKYKKFRLLTDSKFRLNHQFSGAIRRSLKGNKDGIKWINLVDYNLNDLIKRLKQTIPKDFSWQDFLNGDLHIDHIIPINAFEFDKSEDFQFRECWALNNLRLLPAMENIKKGTKIIKPFQTSLRL